MWPWEHLALSYLVVSVLWRVGGRSVDDWVVAMVVAGSQFPDLVDKTLAWYVGVLPAARSLAHSVFTALPVSVVVVAVATYRRRPEWGAAFTVAYAGHLFGDALPKIVEGNYEDLTFLLWPLLPLPEPAGMGSVVRSLRELVASPTTFLEYGLYRTAILVAVVVVWTADGFPGVVGAGRFLSRRVRTYIVK